MQLIDAGQLDRRITLYRMVTQRLGTGEETETPELYAAVWARKLDVSGNERWAGQQLAADVDSRWIIRWRPDLNPLCELRHEGRRYDIISVLEMGRRAGYEVLTRARAEVARVPR